MAILKNRAASRQAPFNAAVAQSKREYPRFANLPLALSTGVGPGYSETYQPGDEENPLPGKLNVQLRSPEALSNKAAWPDDVSLEAIHGLQENDPIYQLMTQNFINTMTPSQMQSSRGAYSRDRQMFGSTEPFEQWLNKVQAQEYIRGMLFPKVIPNWIGPQGEGQYTPQQMKLGGQIDQYLRSGG